MIGLGAQRPEKQFGKGPDNLWAFRDGSFFVIECKSGATSTEGVAKKDLGQLEQSVSWFEERYTRAISKTPIMIHPLKKPGPGATPISGIRMITGKQLDKLKDALESFNKSLGDDNVLNDLKRIADLLMTFSFTPTAFVATYTVPMKT